LAGLTTMFLFAYSGETDDAQVNSFITPFTFGNLGFEKSMCITHPISENIDSVKFTANCDHGTYVHDIISSGIYHTDSSQFLESCEN
jgi:hypothetical protein